MTQKLDYSREDAMEILNNVNFSDEEKRSQYEEYMSELKKTRKNAIVTKLNDLAREIPTITKDIYISVLKKYENDDLSIPFEVIESELSDFEKEMRKKKFPALGGRLRAARTERAVRPYFLKG